MVYETRLFEGTVVFAAVVESGSFARAAASLGVTPSAVSRSIGRLEARLGVRLFHRTTRSVRLTAEGEVFYDTLAPLLSGIEEAAKQASQAASVVSGRLRVSVDPFFSRLVLAPRLDKFIEAYPRISLELLTRETLGDLSAEGIDVAIRFGQPRDSTQVARLLLQTRVLTVASPEYLARRGRPKHPEELAGHVCIHYRDPQTARPFAWEFGRRGEVVSVNVHGPLLVTDVGTMLGACLAGVGVAQVLGLGVSDLLASGQLTELFPDWPDETFPLYAFYPSKRHPAAKVRAFLDFCLQ